MALGPRKLRLVAFEWQSGLSGSAVFVAERCCVVDVLGWSLYI